MENKTSKPALRASRYFKYAIGEILLVVIGILIALQISNWNQNEKDKTLAKTYAKGLVRDLKQDTTAIKQVIQFIEERHAGIKMLINLKKKDVRETQVNDSIYQLFLQHCLNILDFNGNQNTQTQLKNTGDLVLFSESTRDSIIAHEASYKYTEDQAKYYRAAYNNNKEISKKILDFTTFKDSLYFVDRIHTGKPLPQINFVGTLKKEFFNELTLLRVTSKNYVDNFLKRHLKTTENLIAFLTKEYKLAKE